MLYRKFLGLFFGPEVTLLLHPFVLLGIIFKVNCLVRAIFFATFSDKGLFKYAVKVLAKDFNHGVGLCSYFSVRNISAMFP